MRQSLTATTMAVPVAVSIATLGVTVFALSGDTAIHWGLSGEPDRFASPGVAWLTTGGVAVLAGLGALGGARLVRSEPAAHTARVLGLGVSLLFAALSVLVTTANLGDREPEVPVAIVLALLAVGLVAVRVTARSMTSGRLEMNVSRSTGSDVLWEGTSRSTFAVPTTVVLVALGVAMAIVVHIAAGVVVVLAGLSVLSLVEIRVEVRAEALRIRYSGALAWPSQSFRLADVATVEAIEVDPKRYGGWGYRGSLRVFRRAALNLRRGPGLRVELQDGRIFVVTVDDADAAAAVIEPLLAEQSTS